jgi:murein DD-endopeptidase
LEVELKIKWTTILTEEKKRYAKMTDAQKFAFWLLRQYQAPYLWGKETFAGADCSGSVCLALYGATGHLIRTTADDLYKRVFNIAGATSGIRAAFFITEDDRKRDGVLVKRGTAIHVAGLLDEGVILNASAPGARPRRLEDIKRWFEREWCRTEIRGLDFSALERLSRAGLRYGVDKEVAGYFE